MQAIIHPEDEVLAGVRSRVSQAVSVPDVGTSALLAHLAEQRAVRHAVMLGTSGGVTAAWLLDGMEPRGIVTCIEPETRRHTLMTDAIAELGLGDHVRLIHGDPEEASQRLSDGHYDLAVLQADTPTPALVAVAARLLRVGGVLVVRHAAAGDRELAEHLADAPWVQPVVLADGDGVAIAIRDRDTDM